MKISSKPSIASLVIIIKTRPNQWFNWQNHEPDKNKMWPTTGTGSYCCHDCTIFLFFFFYFSYYNLIHSFTIFWVKFLLSFYLNQDVKTCITKSEKKYSGKKLIGNKSKKKKKAYTKIILLYLILILSMID